MGQCKTSMKTQQADLVRAILNGCTYLSSYVLNHCLLQQSFLLKGHFLFAPLKLKVIKHLLCGINV